MPANSKPAEELPARVRRAREALARPAWQFSLRTLLIATVAMGIFALLVKHSTGYAALDFLPLAVATLTVLVGLLTVQHRLRWDGLFVGGVAAVIAIASSATFALWMFEGVNAANSSGRVDWQLVSASDIFIPYLVWLLVLSCFAVAGMTLGGLSMAWHHWQRRRAIASYPPGEHDDRRVANARQAVLGHSGRAAPLAGAGLIGLGLIALALVVCARDPAAVDVGSWLAALVVMGAWIMVLHRATNHDGMTIGAVAGLLLFAWFSTVPIWPGVYSLRSMSGYSVPLFRSSHAGMHLQSVVLTLLWWLVYFALFSGIGARLGVLISHRHQARRALRRRLRSEPSGCRP